MSRENPDFETRVCGIPCGVVIDATVRGWGSSYYEPPEPDYCEWHLVDRRGYRAEWLESKLTTNDEGDVSNKVWQHLRGVAEDEAADRAEY